MGLMKTAIQHKPKAFCPHGQKAFFVKNAAPSFFGAALYIDLSSLRIFFQRQIIESSKHDAATNDIANSNRQQIV